MPAPTSRHPLQAFGLALVAEAALLLGAGAVLAGAAPVAPVSALSEPATITLLSEPAAPPPPLPKPPPLEPLRKLQDKPQNKPQDKPMRMAAPVPPQAAAPAPVPAATPLPAAAVPTAFSEPMPVTPPPAAPATRTDPGADYVAKVRAAVQAAVFYPPAAAALRYSGRVRVEFHLRDGIPGAARVVLASGIGIIDRAALESIQNARYPEAPAEIRGSEHVYLVWVEFTH